MSGDGDGGGLLGGLLVCGMCRGDMWHELWHGVWWYRCVGCGRRCLAIDLDVQVLSQVYDRRCRLDPAAKPWREPERALVRELVARVRVEEPWWTPAIQWATPPATRSGGQAAGRAAR